jgi:hypothetical protein
MLVGMAVTFAVVAVAAVVGGLGDRGQSYRRAFAIALPAPIGVTLAFPGLPST